VGLAVGTEARIKTRPEVSPDRPDDDENIFNEKKRPTVPEINSVDQVIPPFFVFIIFPP
jgi:hypothetical protein